MPSLVKKCRHSKDRWNDCACRWYADIYLDGARKFVPVNHDYDQAKADLAMLVAKRAQARADRKSLRASLGSTDLGTLGELWLRTLKEEGTVRASTRNLYRYALKHVVAWFGDVPIEDITPTMAEEFAADMRASKSSQYAHNIWVVFGTLLRFAVKRKIIETSPTLGIEFQYKAKKRVQLTLTEVDRLIAALRADMRPLAEFVLLTGLRIGEALAIDDSDVDGNILHVRKTITNGTEIGPPKTESSIRQVVMSPRAAEIIGGMEGRFFPWSMQTAQRSMNMALKAAGLYDPNQRHGWHDLRHANTTLREMAGMAPRTAAGQLGHGANISMTWSYGTTPDPANAIALDAARESVGAAPRQPDSGKAAPKRRPSTKNPRKPS